MLLIKKDDENLFNELVKIIAFHFAHSLIQLSIDLDTNISLDNKFKYEEILSKYPNGIYEGDNTSFIVTNEFRTIETYYCYIDDGENLEFSKNQYFYECENNYV